MMQPSYLKTLIFNKKFKIHNSLKLKNCHVNVGQKYHCKAFVKDVDYLAARRLEALDAEDLGVILRGLGIRSSLAILVDGVSPGANGKYARNGTVQVICIAFVSPHSNRLLAWQV